MRVEIRVSGGFAGIRRAPVVLDTAELDASTAARVEALAAVLPTSGLPGRGADLMQYEIAIEEGDARRTLTYSEPGLPAEVRELVRLARERRS